MVHAGRPEGAVRSRATARARAIAASRRDSRNCDAGHAHPVLRRRGTDGGGSAWPDRGAELPVVRGRHNGAHPGHRGQQSPRDRLPTFSRHRGRQRGQYLFHVGDGRGGRIRRRRLSFRHLRQWVPVWPPLPAREPGTFAGRLRGGPGVFAILVAAPGGGHRHHRCHDRVAVLRRRAGGTDPGGEKAGGRRECRQGTIPRQRQPRDAHAAQRRHRDDRPAPRDAACRVTAGDRGDAVDIRRARAGADRGDPRRREDRGRPGQP